MSKAAPFAGSRGQVVGGAASAGVHAPAARIEGASAGPRSAGAMIREARIAQGLHIAALAAAIKVSQHKLELLESDRVDQLPDATFARALAQTVCRFLKIDPQPVLAQLPQLAGYRLDHLSEGINTPFRDRPGRRESGDWSMLASPAVWAPALLVLAALGLYLAPAGWLGRWPDWASRWASRTTAVAPDTTAMPPADAVAADAGFPAPTATAVPAAGVAGSASAALAAPDAAIAEASGGPAIQSGRQPSDVTTAAAATGRATTAASSVVAAASAAPLLQLRANAESWVEVVDARSQVLLQRMLRPGETVSLEGSMPLKLKVGNAAGTEAVFRGQVLNLAATTRDNVARIELK